MGAELKKGDRLARYTVESCLGKGGMGVVYRVHDPDLRRPVAAKVITAAEAESEEFRERFRREARLLAEVAHPNVLPIYDWGEHSGRLYAVTQFVGGGDLCGLLARHGRLAPDLVLRLVDQVACALDAARATGVVHRDVKPANVLLDGPQGREHAYLADFGLACHMERSAALTRSGVGLGTWSYAAPEQLAGERVGPAADVYALALVVYEMLMGRRLEPVDRGQPAVFGLGSREVETRLSTVLRRALSRRPEDRQESAGRLVADVRAALQDRVSLPLDDDQEATTPVTADSRAAASGSWFRWGSTASGGPRRRSSGPWPAPDTSSPVPGRHRNGRALAGRPTRRWLVVVLVGASAVAGLSWLGLYLAEDGWGPESSPTASAAPAGGAAPSITAPTSSSVLQPSPTPSATPQPDPPRSPPATTRNAPPASSRPTVVTQQPVVRTVCAREVKVRREPEEEDKTKVLGLLYKGDKFEVLEKQGTAWVYGVSENSPELRGWILAGTIRDEC